MVGKLRPRDDRRVRCAGGDFSSDCPSPESEIGCDKVKLGATPAGPLVRRGTENQYAHHLIQNPTPVMARRGATRPQPLGFLVADHEEFPEARGSVSVDPDAMRTRARSTSGVR